MNPIEAIFYSLADLALRYPLGVLVVIFMVVLGGMLTDSRGHDAWMGLFLGFGAVFVAVFGVPKMFALVPNALVVLGAAIMPYSQRRRYR